MANGIPVVSTKIGARGLDIPKDFVAISDIEKFAHSIKNIEQYTNREKSRNYVETKFSWHNINKSLEEKLLSLKKDL